MTTHNLMHKLLASSGAAALLAVSPIVAGDYGKAVINDKMPIEDPWSYCDLFNFGELYAGDGFIKEVSFVGRYHGQYISQQEDIDGVTDNGYHEWHHRRFRLGLDIRTANNLKFFAEANLSDGTGSRTGLIRDGGDVINDWQDFYVEYDPGPFFVRVGKQKQHLTREDIESSKRIKTIERSQIVNEVAGARPWGAVAGFELGDFTHQLGAWLHGAHNGAGEWVDTSGSNGGFSYNLSYDVNDDTSVHFDYVFVDNDGGNDSARGTAAQGTSGAAYEHAIAVGAKHESGRFQLMTDVIFGANRTASGAIPVGSDTWGFYIIPSYDITENLEAVFKYAYMESGRQQRTQRFGDDLDGNLNARESLENYHTFYLGLQYFICGEKLKLMGGYEYATGDRYGTNIEVDNSSWMFAVRTYW